MTHLSEMMLQDLADGVADDAAETHAETCPECQTQLDAIRALKRNLSALPRELEPSRDLFPGVRARLQPETRRDRWKMVSLALAAALAAVLLLPKPPPIEPTPKLDYRPQIAGAEATYQHALDDLLLDVEEKKSGLDPKTLATVEANLKVIDEAIRASREALEKDPSSGEAALLVASAYESKLELLRLIERTGR